MSYQHANTHFLLCTASVPCLRPQAGVGEANAVTGQLLLRGLRLILPRRENVTDFPYKKRSASEGARYMGFVHCCRQQGAPRMEAWAGHIMSFNQAASVATRLPAARRK